MIETAEKVGAPREFDAAIAQAVGGPVQVASAPVKMADVQVMNRPPAITVSIPDSTGKARYFDVPEKRVFWAMPGDQLCARATSIAVRPGRMVNLWRPKKEDDTPPPHAGKVTVSDAAGKQLARFANPKQAAEHLRAAGVDYENLPGGDKLPKTGIKKAKAA